MTLEYDNESPIELAPGVFHLGVSDDVNAWANVPYLVVSGGRGALIDAGSAKPEFYEVVLKKVKQVLAPSAIDLLIVQHQDPDLCAAVPLFEPLVSPDAKVVCPVESALLVQHYGLAHELTTVEDGQSIEFGDGRALHFFMTPYAHFVGSMVTYDAETKTLFSSDAFGGFTVGSEVYAGPAYPEFVATFLGQYLGSKRALEYALKRLAGLAQSHGIDRICPQHGCCIDAPDIPAYLAVAQGLKVGIEIDRLAAKNGITLDWQEVRKGGES